MIKPAEAARLRRLALDWCQKHELENALRLVLALRPGEAVWNGQAADTGRFDGQGVRPGGDTGLGLARYLVGEGYLRAPGHTGGPLELGPALLTHKGAQFLVGKGYTYQSDLRETELEQSGPARLILQWAPVADHGQRYRAGRLAVQLHVNVAGNEFKVRTNDPARSGQLKEFIIQQLGSDSATMAEINGAMQAASELRSRYPVVLDAQITEKLVPESVHAEICRLNSEAAIRREWT